MTRADPPQQQQRRRRAFDVERMVVLDDANGVLEIDLAWRRGDRLPLRFAAEITQRRAGLCRISAAAEVEGEGAEVLRVPAQIAEHLLREQEDRRAVDAARIRDRDGLTSRHAGDPDAKRVIRGANIRGAGLPDIRCTGGDRRVEEAPVARRWVGTTHLIDLQEVMRRHHARVIRIELPADLLLLTPVEHPIHAVRYHQKRTVVHLRDEVAERETNRPRQPDRSAVASNRREMAVSLRKAIDITARDSVRRCIRRRPDQRVGANPDKINQTVNALEHGHEITTDHWLLTTTDQPACACLLSSFRTVAVPGRSSTPDFRRPTWTTSRTTCDPYQ